VPKTDQSSSVLWQYWLNMKSIIQGYNYWQPGRHGEPPPQNVD